MLDSFKKRVFKFKNSENKEKKDLAKLRNNSDMNSDKLFKIKTQNKKNNWLPHTKLPPLVVLGRTSNQNFNTIQENNKYNPLSELKTIDSKCSSVYLSDPKKKFLQPIQKKKEVEKINDVLYERLLNKNRFNNIKFSRSQSPQPHQINNSLQNAIKQSNSSNASPVIKKKKKPFKILPPINLEKKIKKAYYYIYPANNGKLVEQIMEKRNKRWESTDIDSIKYCDFIWSPLSSMIDYQTALLKFQFVNHFEYVNQIANKLNLFYNLLQHCEYKKLNISDYFPFTICLTLTSSIYDDQISNFIQLCNNLNDFTPKSIIKYNEYFNILGSKRTGEIQTINIPETFNTGRNMWIIKPINLNRGRCIQVLKNTQEIVDYLEKIKNMKQIQTNENNNIKCEHIILQKYLEKPLLYQGRKFDIRIWILLIANQENFVYIFKQGHLKATCSEFDINSTSLYIHLTNYSVQKHNDDFSKKEIGNEIPYKSFQDELDKENSGKNFMKDIYPHIVYIIRLAIGATKAKINYHRNNNCFEIFGCDFIIDSKYKPYLLEINTNPGFEISSPLINELVPRMIDDALRLTIDEKFPPNGDNKETESFYEVKGYDNKENMWEKFPVI